MKATLVLEDGTSFEGVSAGEVTEQAGEIVLNTAVVGYQEILSDPANAGKIVVFTYPLIGNYGTAKKFYESGKCWVSATVMKEESPVYSNWQAEGAFRDLVREEGLFAMSGVDTRTLAVRIRDSGEMFGIISTRDSSKTSLLKKLKSRKKEALRDFISKVSTDSIQYIKGNPSGPHIIILDLGTLNSFVKQLKTLGCNMTIVPYNSDSKGILDLKPDGLVISSGPEGDAAMGLIAGTIRKLLGKVPMLGISAGAEAIWAAIGGKLKRMKMGHHGVNYPVRSPSSNKGEITVQNHSFTVDEKSIKSKRDVHVTLRNINDNTIEEMESKALKFISVQYYPASPGFDEVNDVFRRFLKMINKKEREATYAKA